MRDIIQSTSSTNEFWKGKHRFERWYRDNQVYFITARCKDRIPAFAAEEAKHIFWTQWEKYTKEFEYTSWITSLLNNHYHDVGYNRHAKNLPVMVQRIHGSTAKLVNDALEIRIVPFWIDRGKQSYFDGSLRDVLQGVRTYRYVHTQCVRHGVHLDPTTYAHTKVWIECGRAIERAVKLNAFLEGVPYARYDRKRKRE